MVSDKTEEKMQRGTCGNDGLYSTHDEHGIAQKTNSPYHTHSLSLAMAWKGKNNNKQSARITTNHRHTLRKGGGGYVSSNNFFDLPKM